jgi:hypothetical protein
MLKVVRLVVAVALVMMSLSFVSCGNARVGVGVSVGMPVGNRGYVSVGATRW